MAETPAKRQKVDCNSQAPNDIPSFEDFAPDGDVIFIVQGKTRVHVHSVVIKCASPVFTTMLKPNFKGRALAESGDSPIEIPLPEDKPEEWGWICRALHCQAHTMLWKPTLRQLWSVWLLVDKYDMKDSMQLSLKLWTSEKLQKAISVQWGPDLWILTVLSIMNRDADNFKIASCELILKGTKPFKLLASNMEHDTQNAASEGVIYRLAGELQATRDCAMMKATKFVYSDLLATLRVGCTKCTETYFQAVERELVKRTGQPTFMEANSNLAVVPHVVSAINEWALESCKDYITKCAANRRVIREQASKFPSDVIDGLCLDCFDKKDRCSEH
ncbi:hypothetical protein HYE67_002355 [Fusarium culmorum]|uniref:BTB domain-containing protein n=1 Tax=Fusarium culmorum TaxID=5516 RepID=A0A2T4GW59_FUSCU|nr:hypothetical protein FCULG_00006577 [Fusarium culmorum]QPC60124.1 hypothetical protein HYE67_002355 [Fusarium culmorum]